MFPAISIFSKAYGVDCWPVWMLGMFMHFLLSFVDTAHGLFHLALKRTLIDNPHALHIFNFRMHIRVVTEAAPSQRSLGCDKWACTNDRLGSKSRGICVIDSFCSDPFPLITFILTRTHEVKRAADTSTVLRHNLFDHMECVQTRANDARTLELSNYPKVPRSFN